MASRRYGVLLAASVVVLAGATIYTFARTGIGRAADAASSDPAPLSEVGDTIVVRDPGLIRPPRSAYDLFAYEDSVWRAALVRPRRTTGESAGELWRPPPRQAMRDRVFLLVEARRYDAAAAELERWLAGHGADLESRIELARLLVAADRLDEAVAHYRLALRLRPDADSTRLDLARVLAWSGRPREAERELVALLDRRPGDTTLVALLRGVRGAWTPTPAEAGRWVAGDPVYAPYRLALARALAGERQWRAAALQLDTLLLAGETVALLREGAGMHASAGDSLAAARLLGRAVAHAPADTALLRAWAEALAWSGDAAAAIDAWTRLLRIAPTGEGFLARGRLYLFSGDDERAEEDLRFAAPRVGYEAWAQLGDLYRWRGDHAAAIHAYRQALGARPDDPAVLASLRAAEMERARADRWGDRETPGWLAEASFAEDNTGFLFVEGGVRRGIEIGRGTTASLGVLQRRVSQRAAREEERYVYGYAVQGAVSHWFGRTRVGARGGVARYAGLAPLLEGGASVASAVGEVRITAAAEQAPAYPLLMSTQSLVRWSQSGLMPGDPLVARQASLALALPLGDAEISALLAQLWLSDGNQRASLQAGVRYPLGAGFALLYSGGTLGWSQRAEGYWDPKRYTSHAAGVEYARYREKGLSAAVRVLPGIARSHEELPIVADSVFRLDRGRVGQLSTSAEARWTSGRWSLGAGVGYGRGREGDYQSLRGSISVRIAW